MVVNGSIWGGSLLKIVTNIKMEVYGKICATQVVYGEYAEVYGQFKHISILTQKLL